MYEGVAITIETNRGVLVGKRIHETNPNPQPKPTPNPVSVPTPNPVSRTIPRGTPVVQDEELVCWSI